MNFCNHSLMSQNFWHQKVFYIKISISPPLCTVSFVIVLHIHTLNKLKAIPDIQLANGVQLMAIVMKVE